MAQKSFWTMSVNGATPVAMSDMGFGKVRRNKQSLQTSTVTVVETPLDYAQNTALNFQDSIIIFRNKTQWFVGIVSDIRRSGSPTNHSISYTISDPWWFIEKIIFEQNYRQELTRPDLNGHPQIPTGSQIPYSFSSADIDTNSAHNWFNNPNNASIFLDPNLLDYYIVTHTTHAYLNGYITNNLFQYPRNIDQSFSLVRKLSGQQITEVLQWADFVCNKIYGGSKFQIGTITPSVDIPSSEIRDQSCAEVIRNQLALSPDTTVYFDYTTTPPTINIRSRLLQKDRIFKLVQGTNGGLQSSTQVYSIVDVGSGLTVSNVSNLETSEVHPRYDLFAPVVVVNYEYQNQSQGQTYLQVITEQYPEALDSSGSPVPFNTPGSTKVLPYGPDAIISTVNMQGSIRNGQSATVTISALPVDMVDQWTSTLYGGVNSTSDPLWQFWFNQANALFADPNITIASIAPVARTNTTPNYVSEGQLAPWMGFTELRETIASTIRYVYARGDDMTENKTADVVTTNAPTGTQVLYDSSNDVLAEPIPSNIPQTIYNSLSLLQYDGTLTFDEEECSGTIGIENTLNITDPLRPEWASMKAMIVSVNEDIDAGKTTVAFGVTHHLGASDIMQILRAMRTRVPIANLLLQTGGSVGSGGSQLGDKVGYKNVQEGADYNPFITHSNVINPLTYLQNNPNDPLGIFATIDTRPTTSGGVGGALQIQGRAPAAAAGSTPAIIGDGKVNLGIPDLLPTVSGTQQPQFGRFRPVRIVHQQLNKVIMAAATDPMPDAVVAANGDPVIGDGAANPAVWI